MSAMRYWLMGILFLGCFHKQNASSGASDYQNEKELALENKDETHSLDDASKSTLYMVEPLSRLPALVASTNTGYLDYDKSFDGVTYIGGASFLKFGTEVSSLDMEIMNKKREKMVKCGIKAAKYDDLYVEDPELGRVINIFKDLSREWEDPSGNLYRIHASLFDESGNLILEARDSLKQDQVNRKH